MGDKRETRKDLPKREFDSDLNDPTFSNRDDPPVDQRDSDHRQDHAGNNSSDAENEHGGAAKGSKKHEVGNADNLSR